VRAFVLDENGARLREDWPLPESRGDWTRVQTRVAGICNTDLELLKGYMGFRGVLGHEFVGLAIDGPLRGRRVVGGINFACHNCDTCASGRSSHCPFRTVLGIMGADGAFAEQFAIPTANLEPVPDQVPDHSAVFAEPLAASCEIVEQLQEESLPPECLVLGDGKLGLLVAQTLAASGVDVTLVGHHVDRLTWLQRRGVRLASQVRTGRKFPLVVEATGSTTGFATSLAAVSPRGTVVLKSTVATRHEVDLSPIVIDEIRVLGSRCGPFAPALRLLADDRVETDEMVDSVFALTSIEEAVARARQPGVLKVLVESR
jgi:threonine dehydrogenase-like Zn-dependent dehydrogenase